MYNIILDDFSAQYIESINRYLYLLIQGLVMYNIILEDFSAQYITVVEPSACSRQKQVRLEFRICTFP